MVSVNKRIGRRVAECRKAAGLSQEKLAEKLRVSPETISRLERGANLPPVERLQEIAGLLGVELHELFRVGTSARQNERDQAMDRLVAVLARRSAEDIRVC
jgi:transcriptional regulator with XRE-family HTH domain